MNKLTDEVEGLEHNLETAQMQLEIQKTMLDELNDKYIGQKILCNTYEKEIKEKDEEIKELQNLDTANVQKILNLTCYIRYLENKLDEK